jgi:hypothetical protein
MNGTIHKYSGIMSREARFSGIGNTISCVICSTICFRLNVIYIHIKALD